MEIPNIYEMTDYRGLMVAPIILLLISLYYIPQIPAGIDFKGGILITLQIDGEFSEQDIETSLNAIGINEVTVSNYTHPLGTTVEIEIEQNALLAEAERARIPFSERYDEVVELEFEKTTLELYITENASLASGYQPRIDEIDRVLGAKRMEMGEYAEIILSNSEQVIGRDVPRTSGSTKDLQDLVDDTYLEATEHYNSQILDTLRDNVQFSSYSFANVMPSLSNYFLSKVFEILIVSIVLVTIVVFIVFRSFVPSIAVLIGAFSDVVIALGAMGLFGIPLTLPSFAAILMLIGFSLDTDMLLTLRIIKRTEGTPKQRAYETMKTGITMSSSTALAFAVLLILAIVTHIPTYYQIAAVAICGLMGDIVATWCLNAVIVLWYVERKGMHGR
ncbi:MAG: hypothetical protein ABIG39_04620 [Candidatus Micrarchaeota archaeon]